MYYDFEEGLAKLAGHRILALNRGEAEKILTVKVEAPTEQILPSGTESGVPAQHHFSGNGRLHQKLF